jgi:hypothetical protein
MSHSNLQHSQQYQRFQAANVFARRACAFSCKHAVTGGLLHDAIQSVAASCEWNVALCSLLEVHQFYTKRTVSIFIP